MDLHFDLDFGQVCYPVEYDYENHKWTVAKGALYSVYVDRGDQATFEVEFPGDITSSYDAENVFKTLEEAEAFRKEKESYGRI